MYSTSKIIVCCLLVATWLATMVRSIPVPVRSQLFDVDNEPIFARPGDENGDLHRNSARLHRTLFLLDTSDLLRKAKIFGEKATRQSKSSSLLTSSATGLFRHRREAKPSGKYINVIKVRKPFLSVNEEDSPQPGMFGSSR